MTKLATRKAALITARNRADLTRLCPEPGDGQCAFQLDDTTLYVWDKDLDDWVAVGGFNPPSGDGEFDFIYEKTLNHGVDVDGVLLKDGDVTADDVTLSGSLTGVGATLSGALSAASATISGALSAASGVFSGALTAGSLLVSGPATFQDDFTMVDAAADVSFTAATFAVTAPLISFNGVVEFSAELRLPNNVALAGENVGGTDYVDLIKINTTDMVVVGGAGSAGAQVQVGASTVLDITSALDTTLTGRHFTGVLSGAFDVQATGYVSLFGDGGNVGVNMFSGYLDLFASEGIDLSAQEEISMTSYGGFTGLDLNNGAISLAATVNPGGALGPISVQGSVVRPWQTATVALGETLLRWSDFYAVNGDLSGDLLVGDDLTVSSEAFLGAAAAQFLSDPLAALTPTTPIVASVYGRQLAEYRTNSVLEYDGPGQHFVRRSATGGAAANNYILGLVGFSGGYGSASTTLLNAVIYGQAREAFTTYGTHGATDLIFGTKASGSGSANAQPMVRLLAEGHWVPHTDNGVDLGADATTGGTLRRWRSLRLREDIRTDAGTAAGGIVHWYMRTTGGILRWGIGNIVADGGSTGADFAIWRYNSSGTLLGNWLTVVRSTGASTITGDMTVTGFVSASTELRSPSLDTVGNTDLTINRNNVLQLTIGSLSATFAGDLTVSGDNLNVNGLTYTWPAAQSANRVLRNTGPGTLAWSQVDLSTDVTGTLAGATIPAAFVSAGTFGASVGNGNYTFPGNLALTGTLTGVTTITTSGAINGQTISATASFTGTLAVTSTITASAGVLVNATLGTNGINWQNAGTNRVIMRLSSSTVWDLNVRDAAGASIDNALSLTMAAGGALAISRPTSFAQTIRVGTSSAPSADIGVWVSATSTTAATAYGVRADPTFPATTTTVGFAGYFRLVTAAAAFTMSEGHGINIPAPSIGAGSTVTTGSGLIIQSAVWNGTTAYGIFIGNVTGATTNYALRTFTGLVQFGDTTRPSATGVDLGTTGQRWDLFAQTVDISGNTTTSGTINGQTISAAANFTGSLTMAGALSGVTTASMSGQLTSTLATGTAPFVVASTTKVANLNADLLDDQTGSYYLDVANLTGTTLPAAIVTSSLTTIGTLVAGAVPASLVTAGTFTGAYTFDTDITYSDSTFLIKANTADGSDSKILVLCGGGSNTTSRGASISLYGEEAALNGAIVLSPGNSGVVSISSTVQPFSDSNFALGSSSRQWTRLYLDEGVYMSNLQVVGARKTGWTAWTGTADRGTYAAYTDPGASAGYVQAEMQAVMTALQNVSRSHKALLDDLHATAGHGLVGA